MKELARRVLFSLATFLGLAVVSFLGVDALPGDGCTALLGRFGSPAKVEACRQENQLNDPVMVRLRDWSNDLVRGDLGYSIKRDEQVSKIILPRIRNTGIMGALAALLAFPSAIVGQCCAQQRNRPATTAECLASGFNSRGRDLCAFDAHDES